jgi:uncharacterized protein
MCKNNEKAGDFVPKNLIAHEYNVIPLDPTITEVLGRRSYPRIAGILEKIDIVNIQQVAGCPRRNRCCA